VAAGFGRYQPEYYITSTTKTCANRRSRKAYIVKWLLLSNNQHTTN